jgi:hypothetical protein
VVTGDFIGRQTEFLIAGDSEKRQLFHAVRGGEKGRKGEKKGRKRKGKKGKERERRNRSTQPDTPAPFSPEKMRRLNPYATRPHTPEKSQYSLS